MIKEYFITNYLFNIIKLTINKKYVILQLRILNKIPKYYYLYLLLYLYNIYPHSIHVKSDNKFYKVITLKYLI